MTNLYASEALIVLYEEIGYKRTWINNVIVRLGHGETVYLVALQQWMYETHGLLCSIDHSVNGKKFTFWADIDSIKRPIFRDETEYDNPQSALESALLKAGELIKEKL